LRIIHERTLLNRDHYVHNAKKKKVGLDSKGMRAIDVDIDKKIEAQVT
jgi:hypothetical protein